MTTNVRILLIALLSAWTYAFACEVQTLCYERSTGYPPFSECFGAAVLFTSAVWCAAVTPSSCQRLQALFCALAFASMVLPLLMATIVLIFATTAYFAKADGLRFLGLCLLIVANGTAIAAIVGVTASRNRLLGS